MTVMTKDEMASKVFLRGTPELILAVMVGRISLRDACWLADWEERIQRSLLEYPGQMSALVKVIKERQRKVAEERREQGQIS